MSTNCSIRSSWGRMIELPIRSVQIFFQYFSNICFLVFLTLSLDGNHFLSVLHNFLLNCSDYRWVWSFVAHLRDHVDKKLIVNVCRLSVVYMIPIKTNYVLPTHEDTFQSIQWMQYLTRFESILVLCDIRCFLFEWLRDSKAFQYYL